MYDCNGSACDSRANMAEIDRRERYEVRMLVSLTACTAPLTLRWLGDAWPKMSRLPAGLHVPLEC